MGKTKSDSWYTYYQGNLEYYNSQVAALAAVDLIIASYDNCIWDDRSSYLSLTCQRGIEVDNELFKKYYSSKTLIPDDDGRTFRVDVSVKNKEDWIFKYGSDLLQQSLRSGYDCNEGYLAERLSREYPDFSINEWSKYKRVDTPNQQSLYACSVYEHSYCSIDKDKYYITIDGYLGKYQLIKKIDTLAKVSDSHSKLGNFFSTKIGSYLSSIGHKLTNADPVVLISSTTTILVGISTLLYVVSCVAGSIG